MGGWDKAKEITIQRCEGKTKNKEKTIAVSNFDDKKRKMNNNGSYTFALRQIPRYIIRSILIYITCI